MREFERRHRAREQRARARLGTPGVLLARAAGDPASTRVWKQGAEGEAKLAKRLEKLLDGRGVRLLHDKRMPGKGRANIDHIAIGPGGVTVIDAKTWHGKVSVESVGGIFSPRRKLLRIAGRDCTSLLEHVRAQGDAVQRLLVDHADTSVDVRCALCFIDVDGLPLWRQLEAQEIVIGGPKRIAKLAARPGAVDDGEALVLAQKLASLLPQA